MLASLLEPFMYHPLNVFYALRGNVKHLFGAQMVWGNMTRKGFQPTPGAPAPAAEGEAVEDGPSIVTMPADDNDVTDEK